MYDIGVVAREPNGSVWLLSMKRVIGRARRLVMPAVSATVVVVVVVDVVVVVMLLCVLGKLVSVSQSITIAWVDDEMGVSAVLFCYVSRSVELKA